MFPDSKDDVLDKEKAHSKNLSFESVAPEESPTPVVKSIDKKGKQGAKKVPIDSKGSKKGGKGGTGGGTGGTGDGAGDGAEVKKVEVKQDVKPAAAAKGKGKSKGE